MPLIAARVVWNAPFRLASSTASQSASVSRSRMLSRVRPALLTRMSIGPSAASAAATAASTCSADGDVAGRRPRRGRPAPRPRHGRAPRPARRSRPWRRRREGRGRSRDRSPGAAGDEGGLAGQIDAHGSCEELLHLVRRSQRDLGPGNDPLEQPGQHVPRTRSPRTSPRAKPPRRRMHSTHRTGAVSWSASRRLASAPVGHRLAARVGDDRETRDPRTAASPSASRSPSTAGAISGEWKRRSP